MLGWALMFLMAGIVAGVLGFGGIAAAPISKIVFFACMAIFLGLAIAAAMSARGAPKS